MRLVVGQRFMPSVLIVLGLWEKMIVKGLVGGWGVAFARFGFAGPPVHREQTQRLWLSQCRLVLIAKGSAKPHQVHTTYYIRHRFPSPRSSSGELSAAPRRPIIATTESTHPIIKEPPHLELSLLK